MLIQARSHVQSIGRTIKLETETISKKYNDQFKGGTAPLGLIFEDFVHFLKK